MNIFYCDTCGVRIPPGEIAEVSEGKHFCSKHRATPGPEPAAAVPSSGQHSRTKLIPATKVNTPRPSSTPLEAARRGAPAAHPPAVNTNAYIYGGAGAAIVLVGIIFSFSGKSTPEHKDSREVATQRANTQHANYSSSSNQNDSNSAGRPRMGPSFIDSVTPTPPAPALRTTPAIGPRVPAPVAPAPPSTGTTEPVPGPEPSTTVVATVDVVAADPQRKVTAPTPATPSDAKNLLADPGFESGAFGAWEKYLAPFIVKDPQNARSGQCCGKLPRELNATLRQVVTGLKPATKYTLTGWIKGSTGVLGVKEHGGADETRHPLGNGNDYEQLSITFTTGAKSTSAKIFARQSGDKVAFVDDLVLLPFDVATHEESATPNTTASAEKIEPAAGAAPKALTETIEQKFETIQENAFGLLEKNDSAGALTLLEQARSDAAFKPLESSVALSIDCVHAYEDFSKAMTDGIAKIKEQRAFTLKRKSGRETPLGTTTKAMIVEVKDDNLVIEVKDGGAVATENVPISDLTEQTRFDMAVLALAPGAETSFKLAFGEFIFFRANLAGSVADVRSRLEWAKKDAAVAPRVAFVQQEMETYLFNQRLEAAIKKIDTLLKDKNMMQARLAYEAFKKEYGAGPSFRARQYLERQRAVETQPGLWASYYSGTNTENIFTTYHFSRAETKLDVNWGDGSPDPRVPADFFGIRYAGLLRIQKAGNYIVHGHADDVLIVKIDGQQLFEYHYNADQPERKVALTAGDHDIRIEFREFQGGAHIKLTWKLEGETDLQDIPASVLWHDPLLSEQYQQGK